MIDPKLCSASPVPEICPGRDCPAPNVGDRFDPRSSVCGFYPADVVDRQHGIPAGQKRLYRRLVGFASKSGRCFPKESRLAEELGCGERQIRNLRRGLEDRGLLAHRRRIHGNEYGFLWHPMFDAAVGSASGNAAENSSPRLTVIAGRATRARSSGGGSELTSNQIADGPDGGKPVSVSERNYTSGPDRKSIAGPNRKSIAGPNRKSISGPNRKSVSGAFNPKKNQEEVNEQINPSVAEDDDFYDDDDFHFLEAVLRDRAPMLTVNRADFDKLVRCVNALDPSIPLVGVGLLVSAATPLDYERNIHSLGFFLGKDPRQGAIGRVVADQGTVALLRLVWDGSMQPEELYRWAQFFVSDAPEQNRARLALKSWYLLHPALVRRHEAAHRERDLRSHEEACANARKILNDPTEPEYMKRIARDLLGSDEEGK